MARAYYGVLVFEKQVTGHMVYRWMTPGGVCWKMENGYVSTGKKMSEVEQLDYKAPLVLGFLVNLEEAVLYTLGLTAGFAMGKEWQAAKFQEQTAAG